MRDPFVIADFSSWDKLEKLINDSMVSYVHHGQYIYFFTIMQVEGKTSEFNLVLN